MKITKPIALITDFDGTISIDDFFWYVIDKFIGDTANIYWQEFLDKKITHFMALSKIFGLIRTDEKTFNDSIDNFPLEKDFTKTMELCKEKGVKVFICSAGADYYIERLIGNEIKKFGITLIANKSIYNKDFGLKFLPPDEESPFFDHNIGISKVKVVQNLKEKGYFCIFAGDGIPDFDAAKTSDVIFARKTLLKMCEKNNLKTEKFDTYEDIFNFIKNLEN